MHCNGSVATEAMTCDSCDEAAAVETHCNGCSASEAMSCNSFNDAAAAKMHCNFCVPTEAMRCTFDMKLQMQKHTATVALRQKQ